MGCHRLVLLVILKVTVYCEIRTTEGQQEKQEQEDILPIQAKDDVGLNQGDDSDVEKGTNLGNILEVKFSDVSKSRIKELKIMPRFFA